jgi:hypothetical protein
MSKTRHYRPEERRIHSSKPSQEKATKYKHDIFKVEDDEDEDEWLDEQQDIVE